ncbi:ATP-binding protein [Shewanella indica]|uniref:ATP-binding protein n=1 Tax=Shewanella indica TaxID=768528 RepID=UPI001C045BDE|nr:ATP-binding protein [Shewanella indica]QWL02848.1 two-component sensor histidine kinase [Shewanella indica]
MKRLFIFSYLVLVFLFFTCFIFVFQLDFFSSDEWEADYQDRSYMSLSQLLSDISTAEGVASAEASLEQVLGNLHKQLRVISLDSDELSADEKQRLRENQRYIKDVEEDISYIMFQGSDKVYAISRDESAPFWQEYYFKESIAFWVLFPVLAFINFVLLYLLARRLRRLERVHSAFANGDFKVRAKTGVWHKVGHLNQSFNQMADKIAKLIDSNKQLTNAVAHEVRTPIFRIRCNLDMLDDSGVRPEQMPYLEGIHQDLDELGTMVDELLHYAKMERRQAPLQLSYQSLDTALQELIAHLQFETDIALELTTAEPLTAMIDLRLWHRAVSNIIRNGYRYAHQKVSIRISGDTDRIWLHIANDGPGIRDEDKQRIFDPFVRIDKSRDRGSGGHGLGLTISAQIIRQHGGDIAISDTPNGGPSFDIWLPKPTTSCQNR